MHAEKKKKNHCFASSKEHKCCNSDSSSNEERVNKCTELSCCSQKPLPGLRTEAKIPRQTASRRLRRLRSWASPRWPFCHTGSSPSFLDFTGCSRNSCLHNGSPRPRTASARGLTRQTLLAAVKSEYLRQTAARLGLCKWDLSRFCPGCGFQTGVLEGSERGGKRGLLK